MSADSKVKLTALNRRGKNYQIIFLITTMKCKDIIMTDPINICDTCLLRFEFALAACNGICTTLLSKISFKKHENAKKSEISHADFEEECLVGKDWIQAFNMGPGIEVVLNEETCRYRGPHNVFMNIEVNIKVYDRTIKPLNQGLYEDATFTDFNLKAEDGMVAVHKAVLSTQSDVFLAMLNQEWSETTEGTFSINGGNVTMQTLRAFKDYMYLQNLPDDLNQLQEMLQIASCYMVDNLKAECITKVVDLVTPENFDDVVEFACLNNLSDLMKAIVTDIPEKVVKGIQKKNDVKRVSTDNTSEMCGHGSSLAKTSQAKRKDRH